MSRNLKRRFLIPDENSGVFKILLSKIPIGYSLILLTPDKPVEPVGDQKFVIPERGGEITEKYFDYLNFDDFYAIMSHIVTENSRTGYTIDRVFRRHKRQFLDISTLLHNKITREMWPIYTEGLLSLLNNLFAEVYFGAGLDVNTIIKKRVHYICGDGVANYMRDLDKHTEIFLGKFL